MKQILKNEILDCETINIRENTPTIDYLMKSYTPSFKLQHVSKDLFEKLQNFSYKKGNNIIDIPYDNFIAGYAPRAYDTFKYSGGLKLSDTSNGILGSFVIEDKRIIYNPIGPAFNEERDSYVYMYSHNEFYTTMTMSQILIELLKRKRKLLIYT